MHAGAAAAAISPAASSSSLAIGRARGMRPRLLLLDEPTEGIQPSIIKDIGRAITYLRGLGDMAIVLVEQYLDFARARRPVRRDGPRPGRVCLVTRRLDEGSLSARWRFERDDGAAPKELHPTGWMGYRIWRAPSSPSPLAGRRSG